MAIPHLAEQLAAESSALGFALDDRQIALFLRFLEMLLQWNARARLTAATIPAEIFRLHFLDSLLCLRAEIPAFARLVDVGSGGGFPGIPLKIARPDLAVTLLESASRKAAFLEIAAAKMPLDLQVAKGRAETFGRQTAWRERFDVATARAVAPLATLCELTLPFVSVDGKAVLLKGPRVRTELEAGRQASAVLGGGSLEIIEAELAGGVSRALVVIPKLSHTPSVYPRRPGMPRVRPLS